MTREEALAELLRPITWNWSSSVRARQNLVIERHAKVNIVIPFLTEPEKELVKEWKLREAHSGLWD